MTQAEPTISHLREQDLYLMQNEHGLIKVGRSIDPERRRHALEVGENCRIVLVLQVAKGGWQEERVHLALSAHRVVGEWFSGTQVSREAIAKVVGQTLNWPFELDEAAAAGWVAAFDERKNRQYLHREISRFHGAIRRSHEPCWTLDVDLWTLLWLLEFGERPLCDVMSTADGEAMIRSWDTGQLIPAFSKDLRAALSLWPTELRPASWHGGALSCAKAAMDARRFEWQQRNGIGRIFRPAWSNSSSTPARL